MIVLGVDPGKQTGWALLEGDDADSLRLVRDKHMDGAFFGVEKPDGLVISHVLQLCAPFGPDFPRRPLVAIERQYGNELLCDTYGRWLGIAESFGLPVVGVWASSWKSRFIGPHKTPRTVVDPETGQLRALLPAEKRAAKRTADEAYRLLAVERFGLPPDVPADVAAACWVAAYAVDEAVRSAA